MGAGLRPGDRLPPRGRPGAGATVVAPGARARSEQLHRSQADLAGRASRALLPDDRFRLAERAARARGLRPLACGRDRPNVAIHAKQVGRVVLTLDAREPIVVGAVGRASLVLLLVRESRE